MTFDTLIAAIEAAAPKPVSVDELVVATGKPKSTINTLCSKAFHYGKIGRVATGRPRPRFLYVPRDQQCSA